MRSAIDIRNIDIATASKTGVLVTHAEAGFVSSVVELTLGLLVDLSRGVSRSVAEYQSGRKPEIGGRPTRCCRPNWACLRNVIATPHIGGLAPPAANLASWTRRL